MQKSFSSPKINKAIEESVKTLGYQLAITHYSSHMTNGILLTQHNQEIAQWSPDPFPREREGSGHKTRSGFVVSCTLVGIN